MVKTARKVRDDIKNVLDYLVDAELALYANDVALTPIPMKDPGTKVVKVEYHRYDSVEKFLISRDYATLEQYRHWVATGSYSAVLFDASLLQIGYFITNDRVTGHRLNYVPCPFEVDKSLLQEGESIEDVVGLHSELEEVALRSPIRFDYDPSSAAVLHPASHLTINSSDCRIGCVAPLHVHRFADFVFRNFYPSLWRAHKSFFEPAAWRHLESDVSDHDKSTVHMMWDIRATASAADSAPQ